MGGDVDGESGYKRSSHQSPMNSIMIWTISYKKFTTRKHKKKRPSRSLPTQSEQRT